MGTIETPKLMLLRGIFPRLSDITRAQITEYAPTFLTEFAVMAGQIVTYKLAAYYLGKEGFSEYAVARRAVSTLYPIALLGFGVALPRFIALSPGEHETGRRDRFFGATLWCVGAAATILIAFMNIIPSTFAYLVYGNASYRSLTLPVSLIIAALSLHTVVYSYFRGHMLMARANILQFTNLAFVPALGFFVTAHNVEAVLTRIGLLSVLVSFIGLLLTPWQQIAVNSLAEARVLLHYGIPRVPGDFALTALLGLPAFLVAHRVGVQEAGYVAFSVSALGMIAAVFAPIGLVLLPKATGLIARGAREELKQHISLVFGLSLLISVLLTALIELTSGVLLRAYLGGDFTGILTTVRIVLLGGAPYAVYMALRSAIDARHFKAINTRNCLIALAVLASCWLVLFVLHDSSTTSLIVPLPISLLVLGMLTWSQARKITLGLETDSSEQEVGALGC
jgi:O-antigen/teichoic acid export membrane protein